MIDSYLAEISKCLRCGKCRFYCPVFEELGWSSTSARGRMLSALALSENVEATPRMIDGLNTCATCGICTETCPSGAHPDEVVEAARRELVSKGYVSEAQKTLSDRVHQYGNTLAESGSRLSWAPDYRTPSKADCVFYVGCMEAYRLQQVAIDTFDILSRFDVALMKDEQCCGSPLLRTGQDATSVIEHNVSQIKKLGASKVITSCAGCYTTLSKDYPKYVDVDFDVVHVAEFFAEMLDQLPLKKLDMTVTYHDPCHIGRHHKIYEAPRKVIGEVCELVEMARNKGNSRCCGGGGGVRIGYDDLSMALAKKRIEDVPDGVDYIVTPCPLCERNLTDAGGKVLNLSTLLKMAIDGK